MPKTATTGAKLAQKATMDWDTQSIHLKPGAQKTMREQVKAAYQRICKGEPTRKKHFNWIFNTKSVKKPHGK